MRSEDLTTGSIRRHLIKMSLFMGMAMVVQTLYGIIDLYWLGKLGSTSLAAGAIGTNIAVLTLALNQILAVGTLASVSQAAGRKDRQQVGTMFNQSLMAAFVLGGLFIAAMFALRDRYCASQASDPETAQFAREFMFYFIPAMGIQFPMSALAAALRGIGDMRTVAKAQGGTLLLNMLLAPFLIFGWGTGMPMGVKGAALASLISIFIGFSLLFMHVGRKGGFFATEVDAWQPKWAIWWDFAKTGIPSTLEFGVVAVYYVFVVWVIKPFGPSAQAAFGIGIRLFQVAILPSICIGFSAAAIAGQNFGALKVDRVRENFRTSLVLGLSIAALFTPVLLFASKQLMAPFTHEADVIGYGGDFLRILSWNLICTAITFGCFATFSGFGDTRPSLFGAGVRIVLIIAVGTWASQLPNFNIDWIWQISVAGMVVQALIVLVLARRAMVRNLGVMKKDQDAQSLASV